MCSNYDLKFQVSAISSLQLPVLLAYITIMLIEKESIK